MIFHFILWRIYKTVSMITRFYSNGVPTIACGNCSQWCTVMNQSSNGCLYLLALCLGDSRKLGHCKLCAYVVVVDNRTSVIVAYREANVTSASENFIRSIALLIEFQGNGIM